MSFFHPEEMNNVSFIRAKEETGHVCQSCPMQTHHMQFGYGLPCGSARPALTVPPNPPAQATDDIFNFLFILVNQGIKVIYLTFYKTGFYNKT